VVNSFFPSEHFARVNYANTLANCTAGAAGHLTKSTLIQKSNSQELPGTWLLPVAQIEYSAQSVRLEQSLQIRCAFQDLPLLSFANVANSGKIRLVGKGCPSRRIAGTIGGPGTSFRGGLQ
jgi:hypothetical protein